jgi:hypothetical protein
MLATVRPAYGWHPQLATTDGLKPVGSVLRARTPVGRSGRGARAVRGSRRGEWVEHGGKFYRFVASKVRISTSGPSKNTVEMTLRPDVDAPFLSFSLMIINKEK